MAHDPVGATGMMVKDYRGKRGEQVVWRFDAALNAQLLDLLKQAAIEEGQLGAKQEDDPAERLRVTIAYLNTGRDRVAKFQREREAADAQAKAEPIVIDREIATTGRSRISVGGLPWDNGYGRPIA